MPKLIIFLLITSNLYCQNLKPSVGIFDMPDYEFYYQSKIRLTLLKNLPETPIIRVTVMPSFEPEYVFQISKNNDQYFSTINIASENIWYAKNYDSIKIKEFSSKINPNDAILLENALEKILNKTQFSNKPNYTTDGVKFNFSVWKNGLKSGSIRSGDDFDDSYIIKILQDLTDKTKLNQETIHLDEEQIKIINTKLESE